MRIGDGVCFSGISPLSVTLPAHYVPSEQELARRGTVRAVRCPVAPSLRTGKLGTRSAEYGLMAEVVSFGRARRTQKADTECILVSPTPIFVHVMIVT